MSTQYLDPGDAGYTAPKRSYKVKNIVLDWVMTVVAGIFVVSYWRGTWELLDVWFCDQPDDATLVDGLNFCLFLLDPNETKNRLHLAAWCYFGGVLATFLFIGMVWTGLWRSQNTTKLEFWKYPMRFLIVYIGAFATVMVWRGIWYMTDDFFFPNDPELSYWVSTIAGFNGCFIFLCGASLLAPPAIFLYDGPSLSFRPPIAITVVATYMNITTPAGNEKHRFPIYGRILDFIFSFLILPWFVVWFWRGCWLLQDLYFWGFTDSHDLRMSLLWSSLLSIGCLYLGSDDFVIFFPKFLQKIKIIQEWVSRLVLLVLAVGVVSFWRVVWYFWDEFLTGSNPVGSFWGSHWLGVVGLLFMGMMSCLCAPPSTLGVDAVPSYEASQDPLFSFVPAHARQAYIFGMFRGIKEAEPELPKCEGTYFGVQEHHGGVGVGKEASSHPDDEYLKRKIEVPLTLRDR